MNQVFLKFSRLRQDNPFADMFGTACLVVELIQFLLAKRINHIEHLKKVTKYLQKLDCSKYRLDKVMADLVNISLSVSLSVIKYMKSEVKN